MQDSPIRIGSVDLQDFEVPTSVRFGGHYKLAVHRLSSGRRSIEQLGPDDTEIQFAGTFSGPQAENRVRDINNLRLSGQASWLTWGTFRSRVIIKTFAIDYRSPWWIPYKMSCLVTHQAGTQSSNLMAGVALIAADLSAAIGLLAGSPIALTSLQSALGADNASVPGTADQAVAINAVQASLGTCDAAIAQSASDISAQPPTPANANPSAFLATVGSAGSLAAAINARAYISRIGSTLQGDID